mgnify:CR=1 FL=1
MNEISTAWRMNDVLPMLRGGGVVGMKVGLPILFDPTRRVSSLFFARFVPRTSRHFVEQIIFPYADAVSPMHHANEIGKPFSPIGVRTKLQ